jgi:hypothetical protein
LIALLDAILARGRQILQQAKDESHSFATSAGKSLTTDTLETVLERLAITPDVDVARQNVTHLFHHISRHMKNETSQIPRRLQNFVDYLERIKQVCVEQKDEV